MIKKVKKNNFAGELVSYQITYENSNVSVSVPLDEANTDYQVIQEWVAKGNTIEEAD